VVIVEPLPRCELRVASAMARSSACSKVRREPPGNVELVRPPPRYDNRVARASANQGLLEAGEPENNWTNAPSVLMPYDPPGV
jgi:hypothetical protein